MVKCPYCGEEWPKRLYKVHLFFKHPEIYEEVCRKEALREVMGSFCLFAIMMTLIILSIPYMPKDLSARVFAIIIYVASVLVGIDYCTMKMREWLRLNRSKRSSEHTSKDKDVDKIATDFKWKVKQDVVAFKLKHNKTIKGR